MIGMRRVNHIHFVGIGGAGMSGIAEVLLNEGYKITGSDLNTNTAITRLSKLGAKIYLGHHPEYVAGASVVVISSAVSEQNCEVITAKDKRIPVVQRAEMLAELMRFRQGLAVAGTHGKTTTTSLLASIFAAAELDPTYVIGGVLKGADCNAKLGSGAYLIAEADESDASFLHLQPLATVITNIDADHMETYGGDFCKLQKTFVRFIHNLPFYGYVVACADEPSVIEVLAQADRKIMTYGFSSNADFTIQAYEQLGDQSVFTLQLPTQESFTITINLPGKHNALNATAALAIAYEEGIAIEIAIQALAEFEGISRRFEQLGTFNTTQGMIQLIDDYGHHPKEIQMTINAVRAGWPKQRVVMIFQLHRYTRTRDLYDDFVKVLSQVDVLILLEVYSAGETPIAGADSRSISRSIRQRGKIEPIYLTDSKELAQELDTCLQDNDLVITQGAGDISQIAKQLIQSEFNLSQFSILLDQENHNNE